MIKNIIFDMGNVLLDYNPQVVLDAFLDREEDKELIKKELFQGPEWILGDLGMITPDGKYEAISKRVPNHLHEGLKHCVEKWHHFMPPINGAKVFINSLKQSGFNLYVLSNASTEFYTYFPKEYDLKLFDGIVVSADIHVIKPDIAIYQYLLDQYHLIPEESLFIDDRLENVEAAQRMGICGEVFRDNFDEIAEQYCLLKERER